MIVSSLTPSSLTSIEESMRITIQQRKYIRLHPGGSLKRSSDGQVSFFLKIFTLFKRRKEVEDHPSILLDGKGLVLGGADPQQYLLTFSGLIGHGGFSLVGRVPHLVVCYWCNIVERRVSEHYPFLYERWKYSSIP